MLCNSNYFLNAFLEYCDLSLGDVVISLTRSVFCTQYVIIFFLLLFYNFSMRCAILASFGKCGNGTGMLMSRAKPLL